MSAYHEPDASVEPVPDAGPVVVAPAVCPVGEVSGRVCAPDKQTWVGGAQLTVTGKDCNGEGFIRSVQSGADGNFDLEGVPEGNWMIHASLGQFSQDYRVQVKAGTVATIPEDQLCVAQKETKIAVVTGTGDKIEQLLQGLNLQFDTYLGDSGNWETSGAPFLTDFAKMKTYDLIFLDCAAAKKSGASTIDLGAQSDKIAANLHRYVSEGGSVYASDWALVFPALAFPGQLTFELNGGGKISSPFSTRALMGFAPQTVNADVLSVPLATFLGKPKVPIAFPRESGAVSVHWGLLSQVDASVEVLIRTQSVNMCTASDSNCATAGAKKSQVPLAVQFKLTPAGTKGGNVVYTSFHNIAQPSDDVSRILKFLVLHL